jgi:hypothetical protein
MPKVTKLSAQRNVPPLEIEDFKETDPATKRTVRNVRYRRGALSMERRLYEMVERGVCSATQARELLELYREHLRDSLEKRGLPSDRTPAWLKTKGNWEPFTGNNRPSEFPVSVRFWTQRVRELTQPLTAERGAAALLDVLGELLATPELDKHLPIILQLAELYSDYRILRGYNKLAYQGLAACKARQQGPKARQRQSAQSREIVRQQAERYWVTRPIYRRQLTHTAEVIADDVNEELRSKGLLPHGKQKLSIKSIAAYIGCRSR